MANEPKLEVSTLDDCELAWSNSAVWYAKVLDAEDAPKLARIVNAHNDLLREHKLHESNLGGAYSYLSAQPEPQAQRFAQVLYEAIAASEAAIKKAETGE
jgi:(2Fe-2S) ferredoxin